MEWPKLKNLILLLLLLVNGFLLVLVGARWEESARYERAALERTVEVLARGGVAVEPDGLEDGAGLAPVSLERNLDRELRMAQALLGPGTVRAENQGGGLYLYQFGGGELSVRPGGELSAALPEASGQPAGGSLERHAAGLLKQAGVDAEQTGVTEEGEWTRIRFRQLWSGAPVFSCEVEFAYCGEMLRSVQGTLLTAQTGPAEAGEILTLPTALMRFSEEIAASGDVCASLRSMEAGYRAAAPSLSGGTRLAPVWLVTTDTARYYLDCVTGALTRLNE